MLNIANIYRQIKFYLKKYGKKNTIKKIISIMIHPIRFFQNKKLKEYKTWIKNNEPNQEELEKQRKIKFKYQPKISIIVPIYNTKEMFFKELINSLKSQTYSNWELCLADGSPKQNKKLEKYYINDERIKYKFLNHNDGISSNTNEALKLATGDFIALLDHDDVLSKFSLFEVVKAINDNPEVEFIYTDEDKITKKGKRFDPYFKTDFAIDTLRSQNYICHLSIFKKELMDKLNGFRKEFDGAQDYDIFLRMTETVDYKNIIHIPKILYHWRVHKESTSKASKAKPWAFEAGKRTIEEHIKRMNLKGTVENGLALGTYKVEYELEKNPKVSILIPNKDSINDLKICINSILEKTTYDNYEIIIIENNSENKDTFEYYDELKKNNKIKILEYKEKGFNYSKIINYGVKNSYGEFRLQLNNDTDLITPNLLELMLGFCMQERIGAVGVKLLYPDESVQHAGVLLGMGGIAGHYFKYINRYETGYFSRAITIQNMTAVTAACMITKREIFEKVRLYE